MKQPGWTVQETGQGAGPLLVRPINPEAPGLALASAGRSLFETGAFLTAEAKEAEERTKRLQRETHAADYRLQATERFHDVQAELAEISDEKIKNEKWEAFKGELRAGLDGLADDETRSLAQLSLDADVRLWDGVFHAEVQQGRVKEASASLDNAWQKAIRLRDTKLYFERLDTAGPIIGMTAQRQAELKGYLEEIVQGEQDKDALTGMVLTMPYGQAVEHLNGMAKPATLNEQEWADFRDALHAKLDVARADAAQKERAQEARVIETGYRAIGAAMQGKLDVTALGPQLERGEIRPDHALTATQIAQRGAATENEPAAYAELNRLLGDLTVERATPQAVTDFALQHAHQLKPATLDAALEAAANRSSPQLRAVEDAVQSASRELVTVTDDVMSQLLALAPGNQAALAGASGQRAQQWRSVDYVRQQLRGYVQAHPGATGDEIYIESRKILRHLRTRPAPERESEIEQWEEQLIALPPGPAPPAGLETIWSYETGGGAPPAPAGLESLWDTLTEQERRDVLTLLARGVPAETILQEAER